MYAQALQYRCLTTITFRCYNVCCFISQKLAFSSLSFVVFTHHRLCARERLARYSAMASLLFNTPEDAIKNLFHEAREEFQWSTLLQFGIMYFLVACWTCVKPASCAPPDVCLLACPP
jgi:hypothetical protein